MTETLKLLCEMIIHNGWDFDYEHGENAFWLRAKNRSTGQSFGWNSDYRSIPVNDMIKLVAESECATMCIHMIFGIGLKGIKPLTS